MKSVRAIIVPAKQQ